MQWNKCGCGANSVIWNMRFVDHRKRGRAHHFNCGPHLLIMRESTIYAFCFLLVHREPPNKSYTGITISLIDINTKIIFLFHRKREIQKQMKHNVRCIWKQIDGLLGKIQSNCTKDRQSMCCGCGAQSETHLGVFSVYLSNVLMRFFWCRKSFGSNKRSDFIEINHIKTASREQTRALHIPRQILWMCSTDLWVRLVSGKYSRKITYASLRTQLGYLSRNVGQFESFWRYYKQPTL